MKKIVIIESREIVDSFRAVCDQIDSDKYEFIFIIFNPFYSKPGYNDVVIPYPNKKDLGRELNDFEKSIIKYDRQKNFFGRTDFRHYAYYSDKLKEQLDIINPDLILGEAASFQDFLTMQYCRENNIDYLVPLSTRYPSFHFAFFLFDKIEPYYVGKNIVSHKLASEVATLISERKTQPDYMSTVVNGTFKRYKSKKEVVGDRLKKLTFYFKGDRNTANPISYLFSKFRIKILNFIWNLLSENNINEENINIVYPLQMQPEANLDLYGNRFINQSIIINKFAKRLDNNSYLYVKTNPKRFFEINLSIVLSALRNKRIKLLPHKVSMDEIFDKSSGFITVTGTIAIECIIANKPILTFSDSFFNQSKNCMIFNEDPDIDIFIEKIRTDSFNKISHEDKVNYLINIGNHSFKGSLADSANNPEIAKITSNSFYEFFEDYFSK